jgi:amino acid transporter
MNVMRMDSQGWINNFALVFQVVTTVGISIAIFIGGSQNTGGLNSSSFVWFTYHNETGYQNAEPYVLLLGLLMSLFSFSGYEAGAHVAEETKGATLSAPRGIVRTCLTVAAVGFIYILALLYSMPSISDVINSEAAAMAVFVHAMGNKGALVLMCLLVINLFFAGSSSLTVTSRIAFAIARDGKERCVLHAVVPDPVGIAGGLPFSEYIYGVWERTQAPVNTVVLVFILDALLLLLPLTTLSQASPLAFNAVTSLTTIGFQISYAIPILERAALGDKFVRGVWNLGAFGVSTLCEMFGSRCSK